MVVTSTSFLSVTLPKGYTLSLREAESSQFTTKDLPLDLKSSFSTPDIYQIEENVYKLSPRVARCVLLQCRNTSEGFFGRSKGITLAEVVKGVFLEEVQKNDLLMDECDPEYIKFYRSFIFELTNSKQLDKDHELINKSVNRALVYINSQENGHVRASALIQGFIMHVNSLIFLDRDLAWEECLECSRAFDDLIHAAGSNLSTSKQENIQILKSFFESSQLNGPFLEALVRLTPIQQKGMLLTVFSAGLDISKNPFYFLLKQLAANPERQEEFYNKEGEEKKRYSEALFREALGLKSHDLITRTTNRGLEFVTTDQKGDIAWRYFIPKGSVLEVFNSYANSHPTLFENPDVFNPHNRCPKTGDALIFGSGCHRCPAKDLILLAVGKLLSKLIENYQIIDSTRDSFFGKILFKKRAFCCESTLEKSFS